MIHPIPPGLYCVPSAIAAITGADPLSVIIPAINRAEANPELRGQIVGVTVPVMYRVLDELGYHARMYRGRAPVTAQVRTWAGRYPRHVVALCTHDHALVVHDGRVYDNWQPHGPLAADHPYSHTRVRWAALIQKKR